MATSKYGLSSKMDGEEFAEKPFLLWGQDNRGVSQRPGERNSFLCPLSLTKTTSRLLYVRLRGQYRPYTSCSWEPRYPFDMDRCDHAPIPGLDRRETTYGHRHPPATRYEKVHSTLPKPTGHPGARVSRSSHVVKHVHPGHVPLLFASGDPLRLRLLPDGPL